LPYVLEVEVDDDDDDGAAVASVRIIEEECVERGRRDRHVFEGVMLAWPVMDGCRTAGAQLSVLALQNVLLLSQADSMDDGWTTHPDWHLLKIMKWKQT